MLSSSGFPSLKTRVPTNKVLISIIFQGRTGDTVTGRPSWTLDGTFLAFRYLAQLVPEFDL